MKHPVWCNEYNVRVYNHTHIQHTFCITYYLVTSFDTEYRSFFYHGPTTLVGKCLLGPTQRHLPDNTQHSQDTDIHGPAGFETTIPASEQPQTHALEIWVNIRLLYKNMNVYGY